MNAVMLPVSASSSQEDVLRLQCVGASVSVAAAVVQWLSSPTLFATPWTMACQASFVHGMLQARILEWGCHFLLQGDLPNPGIKPGSPALQSDALPSEPPQKSSSLAKAGDPNVHKTHLMPKKEITQGSSVPSSVFQQHGGCVEDGIEKESLFKKKVCPLPGRRIHKSTVTRVHGPGLGVRDCPAPSSIHGQVSLLVYPLLPPGHTAQVLRRLRAPPGPEW